VGFEKTVWSYAALTKNLPANSLLPIFCFCGANPIWVRSLCGWRVRRFKCGGGGFVQCVAIDGS
jgi:hypothetical protein